MSSAWAGGTDAIIERMDKMTTLFLISKMLQLGEANMPGEARRWTQQRVDATESSQDGSVG